MRSVKWPLVGFVLGISVPLLMASGARAQDWCADDAKVRERLEGSLENSGEIEIIARCKQLAVPGLIAALEDENSEVRERATDILGRIGVDNKEIIPILIAALENKNPFVRAGTATALGRIGVDAKAAVPALRKALKDEDSNVRWSANVALRNISPDRERNVSLLIAALKDENSSVRKSAAEALGRILEQDKNSVPALIAALKDNDSDVRRSAAEALGRIGGQDKNSVPALIAALKDEDSSVRRSAAEALGRIATTLYDEAENFEQLGKAEKITIAIQQALKNTDFEEPKQQVNRTLRSLKAERSQMQRNRWLHITRNLWLAHLLIWTMLIFAYPRSPKIQTLFFWNPWVRRIIGLWYIGLLLAWLPFLRSRLFAPFRETLLAEAELDRFGTQGYFEGSTVLLKAVNWIQPLQEAIPKIRGQIVLEGESGLGKSMFLHSLAKRSDRILVYLNASRCTSGVMSAIQAKLPGPARDPKFLRDLIYSGAIDICIDGLNEVSADTRARITSFVESYFRGNIIMTTQPLEWTPPATAKTYVLQPLMRSQIEAFLISRATPESSDYEAACRAYLLQTLDNQRPSEVLRSAQRILSNPMDLTLVAQMLEAGKKPDLLSLQQQQYELMAANYQHQYMKPFPLKEFSEQVYQLRLDDKTSLAESVFPEELRSMGRYKIMLARQNLNEEGKLVNHWYFRHDKIMDFFIVQTFLGKDNPRVIEHISDPRFRGVYFLLANQMPLESARALRERLILYAAETQDHSVADTFIQLLRETRTKDDTEKNLTNRSIDKIQLFFEIIYAKIRLDRQFIIIESIKGKLASCTPIIVKFSLNPVEDDVNDLINYVNREVKISQESPVSILIYQNIPDNSAQQLIYQVRLCDHWIIIPIRLGVLEQTLISEEKANGLLTQYINRYMPGTNFFNDRSGIFDDLYFFGRSQVLHSLEQDLLRLQCIGLFGLRKSGKTSILLQLGISMQEHPIIHIDLQPYAGQTYYGADIFNRILQKLSLLLKTAGKRQLNFTAFERDRPAKNITTVFIDRISELAEIFWDAQYKKPIIILLDEIERILPTEADLPEEAKQRIEEFNSFFGTLRSLNQERQILSFLVADLHPDCNIINEWHILGLPTNPIYKFLKEIFVSPFALEDTEMMLTQIGQVMGIKFEANLLKQLHRESGGHPFISRQLASILCQKAYKEKHENGELIRTAAATAFLSQPFKYSDLGDYFEKNIWDDLQNRKQRHLAVAGTATSVLSLLACNQASEKGIREAVLFERLSNEYSISECESALRWLEAIGLVVRQEVDGEDSYTTRVPLMLKWLQRNMRPGEVKQWQLQ